jgi:hypothetical protein
MFTRMSDLIPSLCISFGGFALVAFLLLRFTSLPGFRVWIIAVFVLLSYPMAAGYVIVTSRLCAFLPGSVLDRLGSPIIFQCLLLSSLVAAPVLIWVLLRYVVAVWGRPWRLVWFAGPACVFFFIAAGLKMSPIAAHELDMAWYRAPRQWSEEEATGFASSHAWVLVRAEADHLVNPIGPSRAIRLMHASQDPSGDVFLRFMSRHFSSSADLHLLPVYCWSARDQRLIWKAYENHSP